MDDKVERGGADLRGVDGFSKPAEREASVSLDRILSAVANDHRRAVLNSLISAEGTVEFDGLVDRVGDVLGDDDAEREPDDRRQRIRIALHHTHLPKLQEARMIDYDAEAGYIQFVGGELEQDLLTMVDAYDDD